MGPGYPASMRDSQRSRIPSVPLGEGLYESLYLTAIDADGRRALWLRHTWLKHPGEAPATLWVTWWGPELTQTRGPGSAQLAASGSRGSIENHTWDLRWHRKCAAERPYFPGVLYDRSFPRSNGVVLVPQGTVEGVFDGHDLTGWSAVVGHNWGAEHAHQWEWLHGASGDDWFDQLRVKPIRHLPWLTVADDQHPRQDKRRTRTRLPVQVSSGVEASWDYPSPSGTSKKVRNCSVATALMDGQTYMATIENGA